MRVIQTNSFRKSVKRLSKVHKKELDNAVRIIIKNPEFCASKAGDLAGIRVYKFKINKQILLLAYSFDNDTITLTLLALGSHENFYRDLKRTEL